jgi:hypothetical protein
LSAGLVAGLRRVWLHAPELETIKFDRLLDFRPGKAVRGVLARPQ